MLKSAVRSAILRCGIARGFAAAAQSTAERAQHILALSAPLRPEEPSVVHQQKEFLQQLGTAPDAEQIELAFRVYNKVLELNRTVDKFACARLSLLCLNNGMPARALEPWARLLEVLGTKAAGPQALERILDAPDFEPAALAALAAYFVVAGPAADPETARKLVPRSHVPTRLSLLRGLGGIRSKDAEQVALTGLAALSRHASNGFSAPAFLDQVANAPFAETNNLWRLVELAAAPAEIPEPCYAAFIKRFGETRQTERALKVWQKLVASGVPITTRSWAALFKASLHMPENSEAIFMQLWAKMLEGGFKPDADCMAERLLCLTHNRKLDQAVKELRAEMAREPAAGAKEPSTSGGLLGIRGINVVVGALARARRFAEADELVAWATAHGFTPTAYTYNTLIQAATGKPELASRYLSEMTANGIQPDVVTYTFAAEQMLKRGQPIGDLLVEMREAKIQPNEQFNTVVAYQLGRSTQDVSAARDTMATVLSQRLRVSNEMLGAFVELELRHGDVDRAAQYTQLMHKFGILPNVPTYNQLIRGSLRRRRLDVAASAFETLASRKHRRLTPNTYTYMFLLQPWTATELQNDEAVRRLVHTAASHLAQEPHALDYALAKRVVAVAEATGADLIPPTLHSTAAQLLVDLYDRRKAPN